MAEIFDSGAAEREAMEQQDNVQAEQTKKEALELGLNEDATPQEVAEKRQQLADGKEKVRQDNIKRQQDMASNRKK